MLLMCLRCIKEQAISAQIAGTVPVCGHQRGHAGCAAHGLALRAVGLRTQHHRFSLLSLCRAVQCTRLGFAPCRGFKSWCRLAAHRAGTAVSCLAFVAFTRYGHPLRFYIRPHFVKWSPVATLKLRLVSTTAGAPSRVYKTGLMQSGLRWGGLRAWLCALLRRCAQCSGQWPAASDLVCAPAHPSALPLRGVGPARWLPVRPPRGLPQPARGNGALRCPHLPMDLGNLLTSIVTSAKQIQKQKSLLAIK